MWAQLVKARTQPGNRDKLEAISDKWEEQVGRGTNSGWVRTLTYRNASDPNEVYIIAHFESEEAARRNEQSQQHTAVMQEMAAMLEGQPEYVDLEPVSDKSR